MRPLSRSAHCRIRLARVCNREQAVAAGVHRVNGMDVRVKSVAAAVGATEGGVAGLIDDRVARKQK